MIKSFITFLLVIGADLAATLVSAQSQSIDWGKIAGRDEGGVALAAIQGLNEKVEVRSQESEVRIQLLEAENAELKQENESLDKRLEALEQNICNQKSN